MDNILLETWYRTADVDIIISESNRNSSAKFVAVAIDKENGMSFKSSGNDKYSALCVLKKMVDGNYFVE